MSETRKYRKFSAQQKTEIVLASLRGPKTIAQLCREHDISESLLRKWRDQFLAAGAERLPGQGRTHRGRRAARPGGRARARAGAQDDGGGDRGGTLAGLGVSERVARSRELVAQGRPAAVVARVAGISRQAIYRRPRARAARAAGARWTTLDRVVLAVAREDEHATDGTRMIAAIASRRAGRAINRKRCQRLMREHRAAAARPQRGPPAPAGLLPGHPPRRALASGHDLGLGRRARLELSERRDRLLHPRDRRLGAGRPLPRPGGDRGHRPRRARARHRARPAHARAPTTAAPTPPARSASASPSTGSRIAAAATATPRARPSSSPGSPSSSCAASGAKSSRRSSKPAPRSAPTSTATTTARTAASPTDPGRSRPHLERSRRPPNPRSLTDNTNGVHARAFGFRGHGAFGRCGRAGRSD